MLCNKLKDKTIMLLGYYHHPQCGREQHKLFLCSFFGFFSFDYEADMQTFKAR